MKSDDSDAVDDSSAHSGGMFRRRRPWRHVTFRAKDDTSRPVSTAKLHGAAGKVGTYPTDFRDCNRAGVSGMNSET